jgi:hypothetical protein
MLWMVAKRLCRKDSEISVRSSMPGLRWIPPIDKPPPLAVFRSSRKGLWFAALLF